LFTGIVEPGVDGLRNVRREMTKLITRKVNFRPVLRSALYKVFVYSGIDLLDALHVLFELFDGFGVPGGPKKFDEDAMGAELLPHVAFEMLEAEAMRSIWENRGDCLKEALPTV
jgi:hypothetical protein